MSQCVVANNDESLVITKYLYEILSKILLSSHAHHKRGSPYMHMTLCIVLFLRSEIVDTNLAQCTVNDQVLGCTYLIKKAREITLMRTILHIIKDR